MLGGQGCFVFERGGKRIVTPPGTMGASSFDWSVCHGALTIDEMAQGIVECWELGPEKTAEFAAMYREGLAESFSQPPLKVEY